MSSTSKSSDRLSVHFDVVILGGGPAGVSCALELKDNGIDSLILERSGRLGGALPEIPTPIPNLASGWVQSGKALQDMLCQAAEQACLKVACNQSIISCDLNGKRLDTQDNSYTAKILFLATGYRLRRLQELQGLDRFGQDLAYRTGSNPDEYVDKEVTVLGGGESAVYEALEREKTAKSVTLIVRAGRLKSRPELVKELVARKRIKILYNRELQSMHGDAALESIVLRSTVDDTTQSMTTEKVVAKLGYTPNTELFSGQVDMDQLGHIKVGPGCRTSTFSVFAGGDIVTPGHDRIATAMGHGSIAAGSIKNIFHTTNFDNRDW